VEKVIYAESWKRKKNPSGSAKERKIRGDEGGQRNIADREN